MKNNEHIIWHNQTIDKEQRREKSGHHSFILWFTGLSGSGKSTLANAVALKLYELCKQNYVLDGDNIRHGLNKDLGFSDEDRKENIRRIGEVSKLFVDSGVIVLTAFISPFLEDRQIVRDLVDENEFIEVYVKCNLTTCEKRDPKGLYKKARKGEIPFFTGISSPYESPVSPELIIETDKQNIDESVTAIIDYLRERKFI